MLLSIIFIGKVSVYMKEVFSASECFILVKLDMQTIQDLHLDVNVHTVRHSILKGSYGETRPRVLRDLKPQHVTVSTGGHKVTTTTTTSKKKNNTRLKRRLQQGAACSVQKLQSLPNYFSFAFEIACVFRLGDIGRCLLLLVYSSALLMLCVRQLSTSPYRLALTDTYPRPIS